ncbi:hypothetical protein D9_0142 [Aeromonas phage D9]|nr:hypothetical protein D9_0142 [Aeromonas phage D9]
MFIFLVSRDFNNVGYDQYISFACVASTAEEAKMMKPWEVSESFDPKEVLANYDPKDKEWIKEGEEITIRCAGQSGEDIQKGVIHTSYHHA